MALALATLGDLVAPDSLDPFDAAHPGQMTGFCWGDPPPGRSSGSAVGPGGRHPQVRDEGERGRDGGCSAEDRASHSHRVPVPVENPAI